jgi:hypothetical protein
MNFLLEAMKQKYSTLLLTSDVLDVSCPLHIVHQSDLQCYFDSIECIRIMMHIHSCISWKLSKPFLYHSSVLWRDKNSATTGLN